MSISCLLCVNTYTNNTYIFRYCNLSNSKCKSNGLFLLFLFIYMQYIFYFIFFPSLRSGIHTYIFTYIVYMVIYVFIYYNHINNSTHTYVYMYTLPHIFYHDAPHNIKKKYIFVWINKNDRCSQFIPGNYKPIIGI